MGPVAPALAGAGPPKDGRVGCSGTSRCQPHRPVLGLEECASAGVRAFCLGTEENSGAGSAGPFDDFWGITQSRNYAAFLYTSAYDGLPNVLLEAAAAGLPIVTPNVGGIAELVSDAHGYLLPANAEASRFVLALREILGDAEGARRRATAAQKVVLQRHSWQAFNAGVLAIPGYAPRSAITTTQARCP